MDIHVPGKMASVDLNAVCPGAIADSLLVVGYPGSVVAGQARARLPVAEKGSGMRSRRWRGTLAGSRPSSQCRHSWIEETGYSFPSGHSFSAMFFATFFLAMGVSHISTKRLRLFYLLLPWALAVCYSRPILRVHTPTDITVGGLEGLVLGFLAFLFVRAGLTAWHERIS